MLKTLRDFIRKEDGSMPALYAGMGAWVFGLAVAGLYAVWPMLNQLMN